MKDINKKKERDSKFELLRLVSMLSILLFHFIQHSSSNIAQQDQTIIAFFIPFIYFGVNCFILTSGYFRIKFKISSLVSLYFLCIFYSGGIYLITSILVYDNFEPQMFMYTLMPLTHNSGLWFIPTYICLFLISPLLNAAIDYMSKNNFISVLLIYLFCIAYFYCYRSNVAFMGNVSVFTFFYLTGAFIQKHVNLNKIKRLRFKTFLTFIISCCILGTLATVYYRIDPRIFWQILINFANPIIIVISISIFLFFSTLRFKSSFINYLAASSLAIYLIHENVYMQKYTYKFVAYVFNLDYLGLVTLAILIGYALLICFCCIFIDKARIIIMSPVNKFIQYLDLDKKYDKLLNLIASITETK